MDWLLTFNFKLFKLFAYYILIKSQDFLDANILLPFFKIIIIIIINAKIIRIRVIEREILRFKKY